LRARGVHYVRVSVGDAGAYVTDDAVTFVVPDPAHSLSGVRLVQDVRIPGDQLDFARPADDADRWILAIRRPPVLRMEYLLEWQYPDGGRDTGLDPGNPRRVDGAFGPKSVLEFPGYAPPRWLAEPAEPGASEHLEFPVAALNAAISVRVWTPADALDDEPLPMLFAHDGPEYDALSQLTGYLSAGLTGRWLPRLRAALLSPGPRDRWYSANAGYARALRRSVMPALVARYATKSRVGVGASLGALALLHAHCHYPDAFDALLLESGSFFSPEHDGQERRFPFYRRIVKFVTDMQHGRLPGRPIPVTLTCGVIEENLANNRAMTGVLTHLGYQASLHELADMHNYTAWRDAFDPNLTELLWQVCP
jgi:enterochelin esterase-like enzyme